MRNTPQVWVGCLAAYNNMKLHGKWVDLTQDWDDIQEEVSQILKTSPEPNAEEWDIFDTEYVTSTCLETAKEEADFYVEHGELGQALLKEFCGDLERAVRAIENEYIGEYSSEESYATESFEELYSEVPAYVMGFVDFERVRRDWFQHGTYYSIEVDNVCHVFDSEL